MFAAKVLYKICINLLLGSFCKLRLLGSTWRRDGILVKNGTDLVHGINEGETKMFRIDLLNWFPCILFSLDFLLSFTIFHFLFNLYNQTEMSKVKIKAYINYFLPNLVMYKTLPLLSTRRGWVCPWLWRSINLVVCSPDLLAVWRQRQRWDHVWQRNSYQCVGGQLRPHCRWTHLSRCGAHHKLWCRFLTWKSPRVLWRENQLHPPCVKRCVRRPLWLDDQIPWGPVHLRYVTTSLSI